MKKIFLGIVSGLICGLFASGGGLILVPAYIYILKMDEVKARATSVFSILPMVTVSRSYILQRKLYRLEIRNFVCNRRNNRRNNWCKIIKKNSSKIFKNIFYNIFTICINKNDIFLKL